MGLLVKRESAIVILLALGVDALFVGVACAVRVGRQAESGDNQQNHQPFTTRHGAWADRPGSYSHRSIFNSSTEEAICVRASADGLSEVWPSTRTFSLTGYGFPWFSITIVVIRHFRGVTGGTMGLLGYRSSLPGCRVGACVNSEVWFK